jgi:pimeloyl-ACP methyl ester carboxylesterase
MLTRTSNRVPGSALPSPYADRIARVPVRVEEVALRGAPARVRTYGPPGAARRIVFLHGLRGDHHGLEPIVAHLLDRDDGLADGLADGVAVVVPDLPGFGGSPPMPADPHDVTGYARWTRDLLAAVDPDGTAVLAGHSFGSIVAAAAVAAGAPARALVLVNPIATSALAGPHRVLTKLTVLHHRAAAALPERAGTWLLRNRLVTRIASAAMVTTPDRRLRRWIHAEHDRYFGGFAGRRTLLQSFHASVRHDVAEYARDVPVPTLLVAAERDDIAPLPAQRALRELFADARLVVVPGTGHLAHYEAPAEVAAAIAGCVGA